MNKVTLNLVFIFLVLLSSCESDDICDSTTPTTPSLVIEVYDRTNTATLKNVTNLKIREVGNTEYLTFSGNILLNTNKFKIPLKNNSETVKFEFTLNGEVNSSGVETNPAVNKDIITFDYTTKSVYISRACGYKITYTMDNFTYIDNVDDAPTENFKWINNAQLITNNITNEDEIHLKIFY